jgi:hypothetical protein
MFSIVNCTLHFHKLNCGEGWELWHEYTLSHTIVHLPFRQQIAKQLIKFEVLTSTLGFLILKILASNGYMKQ